MGKRLTSRGFIAFGHEDRVPDLIAEVGSRLREGGLTFPETVVDGLENARQAFIDMPSGADTGKTPIRSAR
ncbi:hypothetical protein [Streptosporangium sp. NBC_01469]|uniref:hypothetical protein n=1 Tax=Streptosporangium sp. NBC_01469 TaxID=2903898 RepID=UPI002E29DDB0|nr:hypothetical protein [Streptosporangium sp. NBC_01469]